jgi:hypothetical protein
MKLGIALVDVSGANYEHFDVVCRTQPDTWKIAFHSSEIETKLVNVDLVVCYLF